MFDSLMHRMTRLFALSSTVDVFMCVFQVS